MANPDNALGTNGAFGGRTSVNAFNDVLSAFSGRGILSGWECSPSSGLTVTLGGDGETRDVAIAEDPAGNKTTINNIIQSPVSVTIPAAPASNSRIDLIVAYIEDSPQGSGETDNYDVVNLLVVSGSSASTPVAPTDSAIRTAITADGASGTTAYYVVLASITISTGTTDITSDMITQGDYCMLPATKIDMPSPVVVEFGSGNTTAVSTRQRMAQATASGFDTNWQYLCIMSIGLFFETSGNGAYIAFGDVTENSSGDYVISQNRLRGNGFQTTISFSTLYTPSAENVAMNFNGHGSYTGVTFEDATAYFIPVARAD